MNRYFTILLMAILVACKAPQAITQTGNQSSVVKDSVVVKEVLRPVVVKQPGDSISASITLRCNDSIVTPASGQVKGQRTTLTYQLDSKGRLLMDCRADSLKLELYAKDMIIERLRYEKDSVASLKQQVMVQKEVQVKNKTPRLMWWALILLLLYTFRWQLWGLLKQLFKLLPFG
jgi:hypothetical protein